MFDFSKHGARGFHDQLRLVEMDPVSAFIGDDVMAMLGMSGEAHVLRHPNWGLMRAGNYRDWNVRRDVAAGNFSGADR